MSAVARSFDPDEVVVEVDDDPFLPARPAPAAPRRSKRQGPVPRSVLRDQVAPVSMARTRQLPVLDPLRPLLPDGLVRGTCTTVKGIGASSLALALAAGASQAGSWVAGVGLTSIGLASVVESGCALSRWLMVADPPPDQWASVLSTLVDSVDVILLSAAGGRTSERARLLARVRQRGAVVVVLPARRGYTWGTDIADLALETTAGRWEGAGEGSGHLRQRRVTVEATGRRQAARPRRTTLLMPGPGGGIDPIEPEVLPVDGLPDGFAAAPGTPARRATRPGRRVTGVRLAAKASPGGWGAVG